jgi:ferrochelatase
VRDVRRYLGEFLMDGYVIDVPYVLRRLIVSLFILPSRPRRSARAYASIWRKEGSPLIVISRRVQALVQEGFDIPVALAMRYGSPSIRSALQDLLDRRDPRLAEILLVPLYPHYAMPTVGGTVDEVRKTLRRMKSDARLEVLPPFFEDDLYIGALAESMRDLVERGFDHLLFSYHGLPERHLRKADPTSGHCLSSASCCGTPSPAHAVCYRHQVLRTTELVAEKLALAKDRYSVAFQSRFGMDKWLAPSTSAEIVRLARSGVKRLLVVCPAFVSDCLETLEEIGIRGRESFLAAGGESFNAIPCLNHRPSWIVALKTWCSAPAEREGSERAGSVRADESRSGDQLLGSE